MFAKQRGGIKRGRLWDQRSENVVLFQVSQLSRATPCFPHSLDPPPFPTPLPPDHDPSPRPIRILKSLGLAANKIFIPPKNTSGARPPRTLAIPRVDKHFRARFKFSRETVSVPLSLSLSILFFPSLPLCIDQLILQGSMTIDDDRFQTSRKKRRRKLIA